MTWRGDLRQMILADFAEAARYRGRAVCHDADLDATRSLSQVVAVPEVRYTEPNRKPVRRRIVHGRAGAA
jgi:hypothetical protein